MDYDLVSLIYVCTSWFLCGFIWLVQIVHYPLFANVIDESHPDHFVEYERRHKNRLASLIGTPWALQGLACLALTPVAFGETTWPFAISNLALAALIVGSTVLIQVPLHTKLSEAPDHVTVERLVKTNWIRTSAWSAQALLSLTLI